MPTNSADTTFRASHINPSYIIVYPAIVFTLENKVSKIAQWHLTNTCRVPGAGATDVRQCLDSGRRDTTKASNKEDADAEQGRSRDGVGKKMIREGDLSGPERIARMQAF